MATLLLKLVRQDEEYSHVIVYERGGATVGELIFAAATWAKISDDHPYEIGDKVRADLTVGGLEEAAVTPLRPDAAGPGGEAA